MKIVVVNNTELNKLPPVKNLIKVLARNGYDVTVITEDSYEYRKYLNEDRVSFVIIPSVGDRITISSIITYLRNKRILRRAVVHEMSNAEYLWTTTDKTVRELGSVVLKYNHIMQLMELIEDTPAFPKQRVFWIHLKKYARSAYRVVVPEYNRAHILKAWWDLRRTPMVLPNKIVDFDVGTPPENVMELLKRIDEEKRKIILYQGMFGDDRDFESFARAVEETEDFCLYLMGRKTEKIVSICKRYRNTYHIDYVEPPYHLLFTKRAYIGLLPYQSARISYLSVLNGIYCAPNKIWDYALNGIPMLGFDVPGLTIPFKIYGMGETCVDERTDHVLETIRKIDCEHENMSFNCRAFFNSVDIDSIVNKILVSDISDQNEGTI